MSNLRKFEDRINNHLSRQLRDTLELRKILKDVADVISKVSRIYN